jgi:hypothetical protein
MVGTHENLPLNCSFIWSPTLLIMRFETLKIFALSLMHDLYINCYINRKINTPIRISVHNYTHGGLLTSAVLVRIKDANPPADGLGCSLIVPGDDNDTDPSVVATLD